MDYVIYNTAGAELHQATISDNFTGARESIIKGAAVEWCIANGRALAGADLALADLSGLDFSDQDLADTDFKSSNCSDADFANATVRNANFVATVLLGADFADAELTGADFTRARVDGAIFPGGIMPENTSSRDIRL